MSRVVELSSSPVVYVYVTVVFKIMHEEVHDDDDDIISSVPKCLLLTNLIFTITDEY